jgi:nicotinate-nucleotide--dimethylbenzimidazole phosphoribosyltransferase
VTIVVSKLTLEDLTTGIRPPDRAAASRARRRQASLTKPPGSLGVLERLSVRLAGICRAERPAIHGKTVIVAAGDHGVVAQGVTVYPQAVTAQMVGNFLAGGAAVSVMARAAGVRLRIVDAGVAAELAPHPDLTRLRIGNGTGDISQGPAMSRAQAERCILEGAVLALEEVEAGADVIGTGDMGIGNTTSSSAIVAALTGEPPERTTGAGTGRTPAELVHKAEVVAKALAVNRPRASDPIDVLAKVGGFEIGVLTGVILGAASAGRPIVLDGFISGSAALIADAVSPHVRGYMVAAHRSAERGHRVVLRHLGLRPLLDLRMRLGEGTGAVLAMGLVEAAAACLSDMATFEEAQVQDRGDG